MKSIDPNQKVGGLLEIYPETYAVFKKHGCPDMRDGFFSVMARIMSIQNAARIHRISLDELLEDLEAMVQESTASGSRNLDKEDITLNSNSL